MFRQKESGKNFPANNFYFTVMICIISVEPIPIALEPVTIIVSPGCTNPVSLATLIPFDKISSVVYLTSVLTGNTPQAKDN